MSAGEYVTRVEFERERDVNRERFSKMEARQDEHAAELKQLKELIVEGFRDLRSDVQGLRSFSRRFAEGLAVGAGISYALYQAIHATLGGHL